MYKNAEKLWQASGSSLATITEDGFAVLTENGIMSKKRTAPWLPNAKEQVKNDLATPLSAKANALRLAPRIMLFILLLWFTCI